MHRIEKILIGLSFTLACSHASAQQMMDLDGDYVLPNILFENHTIQNSTLEPVSLSQLSAMRAGGIDPSWVSSDRYQLPRFDPSAHRVTQDEHPLYIESWATHYTDQRGLRLNDSLIFSVGRTTELRDGNISGSEGALDSNSGREHLPSLAQSEGEYDVYDLSLEWEAINAGPVTISVLSGLKAIEANIGKRVTIDGETSIESVHRFTAMPMIGSGLRWKISDDLSFSGAALTHPIDAGDALIDFNASTTLQISKNVDFSAGYRIIRSSFEVGSLDTEIRQEGLFARLQIKF